MMNRTLAVLVLLLPCVAHAQLACPGPTYSYQAFPNACSARSFIYGKFTSYAETIDGSGVSISLSGTSYTVPAGTDLVRFTQSATDATQTVTLPTALADGQVIQFDNYAGAITALTFSPAVVGWTNGSQFSANTGVRVRWDANTASWHREQ